MTRAKVTRSVKLSGGVGQVSLPRTLTKRAAVMIGIWIMALSPVFVLIGKSLSSPLPDVSVANDPAIIELYTLRACSGTQLHGPYSRFRFHHPGPAMFYALMPFYALGGKTHGSLCVGSLFWNSFWLTTLLFIPYRLSGPRAVWISAVPVALFVLYMRPPLLWSVWNPDTSVLPFGVSLLALFAVGSGRIHFLPAAVFSGSIALQSHLVYVFPLSAAGLAAIMALVMSRSFFESERPTFLRRQLLINVFAAVVLGAALWSLPIAEEVMDGPGNLTRLIDYSLETSPGRAFPEATVSASQCFSAFLFSPLGVGGQHGVRTELAGWSHAFSIGQMLLLVVVGWRGVRARSPFALSYVLCGVLVVLAAVFTVRAIEGSLHGHLVRWIAVLGLFNLIAVTCVLCSRGFPLDRSFGRGPSRAVTGVCFAILLLTSVMGSIHFGRYIKLEDYLISGWGKLANGSVWPQVESAVAELNIKKPHIRILDRQAWPIGAALVLQLEKVETRPSVDQRWEFMFGNFGEREDTDGLIVVAAPEKIRELQNVLQQPGRVIQSTGTDILVSTAPQRPFSGVLKFSDPLAELYLRDGFSKPKLDADGGYRWSLGSASTVSLPLVPATQHILTLDVAPFSVQGKDQTLHVVVNGQQVATFSLQRSGWSRLTCQIPADAITKNNTIVFRHGYATAPRDVSDSRDRRKLGVRFSSLSIRAQTRQGIDAPTNG